MSEDLLLKARTALGFASMALHGHTGTLEQLIEDTAARLSYLEQWQSDCIASECPAKEMPHVDR